MEQKEIVTWVGIGTSFFFGAIGTILGILNYIKNRDNISILVTECRTKYLHDWRFDLQLANNGGRAIQIIEIEFEFKNGGKCLATQLQIKEPTFFSGEQLPVKIEPGESKVYFFLMALFSLKSYQTEIKSIKSLTYDHKLFVIDNKQINKIVNLDCEFCKLNEANQKKIARSEEL